MKTPPSVAMLSWEYPPRIVGGIAPHVYDLSRELVKLGSEVTVVTCEFPGAKEREVVEGVQVFRVDAYRFPAPDFASWVYMMNVNMQTRALEIMKGQGLRPDVIHAHDWLVATAAIGLKHLFRVPLVATIHSTEDGRRGGIHSDYNRMIHQTEGWLTSEAERVVCCSNFMANHIAYIFGTPRSKIAVIPNGVDPAKFTRPYDWEALRRGFVTPHEKLILYVGRLVHEKGINILVDAMHRILGRVDAKLVIVGDGYLKDELLGRVRYQGLVDKVYITGFLDDSTLKLLYRTADVCVVPSLYEPFGIVALEAMAAGAPLVVSDTGGLSEVVEDGVTGLKVPPWNPNAIADAVIRILTDRGYGETLAQNAFKRVMERYGWRRIAEKTAEEYRSLLASS